VYDEAEIGPRQRGNDEPPGIIDARPLVHAVATGAPPLVESADTAEVIVRVSVTLDGASEAAKHKFAESLQVYADRLAQESERQEISNRAPGANVREVTASSVIRACEILDTPATDAPGTDQRKSLTAIERFGLAGIPLFSGACGALASYLNSPIQWLVFLVCAAIGLFCILYSLWRRLL
jgi:hypothetical protein